MVTMSLKMVVFLVKNCAVVTTRRLVTLHVPLLTIIVTKNALFTRINFYLEDTRKNTITIIITVIITVIITTTTTTIIIMIIVITITVVSVTIITIIKMKVVTVMKMVGSKNVL